MGENLCKTHGCGIGKTFEGKEEEVLSRKLTTEQKNELEKVIRDAVPESMELKRGCIFHANGDTWLVNCSKCQDFQKHCPHVDERLVIAFSCSGDAHDMGRFDDKYREWNREKLLEDMKRGDIEILGRPLQLADVLIAIGNIANVEYDLVDNKARLWMAFMDEGWQAPKGFTYDLTKDYHHQSDEFYSFLYSLLCS